MALLVITVHPFAARFQVDRSCLFRRSAIDLTQDFLSSEIREGAVYRWQVIDNGKVAGAAMQQRKVREINEITWRKLETNLGSELLHIRNDLVTIESRQKSLEAAVQAAADQNVTVVQQNLAQGLALELAYRLAETSFLKTKSGLVDAMYLHTVALAEWDWATGRYFQFSKDTVQNVH